jgi:polar amino acid transport system substrate-binding protein
MGALLRIRSLAAAAFLAAVSAASAQGVETETGPSRVVVGADPDYPPYEFLDKNGQPAGFNVDLTRAVAEVMGMTIEFRFGNWAEIRQGLLAGEIDVLEGISWSEERAKSLDFAPPHSIVHHAIFARKDTPAIASLDGLAGKEVIVFRGGIMDEAVTRRGDAARIVRVGTPADALRRLAAGQGDYVALALLPGVYITRELGLSNVAPVARRVAVERYGYAVRRGNSEMLARFDAGLAILKKTGRYDAIRARWLGPLEPQGVPWGTLLRWAAIGAVPLLLAVGGTVLWSRSLQRLVAQRTESLEREVGERKRAVEELRLHQEELVQAHKMTALGVLVSGVAHEINNPNGFILLNMPTLKAAFADALEVLDERHREDPSLRLAGIPYPRMRQEIPLMLDEMMEGGRRIKHIVDDLKDFARREDAPRLEPTDLNEVARAAVRLLDAALRKATTRFELDLAGELPRVQGNARRISQVVVNLLVNACQALPAPDRAVRLATRHDAARGEVILSVEDEGVGIPPEHLSRITDPFFTTKRETGGTGLGLSVSARIVKEHGGTLEFRSEPGAGTVAALVLPALREVRP